MHPVLLQFGPFTIYTYGVLVAAGFLVGLFYAYHHAADAGLDKQEVWNLAIYGILIGLAASKIWLVASAWDYYRANPGQIFSIETFESAGTFYGGIVGGAVWVLLYTHFQKMSLLPVLDLCAAPVALGHAIGRIGCFAAGCCYGKPTTLPWGVTFTSPIAEKVAGTPLNIRLHPTQLYEATAEFANFLLLIWLGSHRRSRMRFPGQLVGAYCILYGIERGAIEFLRDDPGRTMMFHDSVSLMQLVSLALILAGAFLWWHGLRREPAIPPAHATIDSPSPS